MSDIKFYIPENVTVPTYLQLFVGDVHVLYERIENGFRFHVDAKDEKEALKVADDIIRQIKAEHNDPRHGYSWRTFSMKIIPQEERYRIGTIVEWKYRVRDSY